MKKLLLLLLLFSTIAGKVFSQAVGDYRSASSGVWFTATTWQTWNGTVWIAATSPPSTLNNVRILNGHTIIFDQSSKPCLDLVVDAGGKLFSNSNANNFYLNVFGDTILCNGTIGNPPSFDGLSFNIEGDSCKIIGSISGVFDASRIRKSASTKLTTNLSIERDVTLRFGGGRQTQIYNNIAGTKFNVTVGVGAKLLLDSTISAICPTATGNNFSTSVPFNVASNSVTVSGGNTTGLTVGQLVSGPGIVLGTTIASITNSTTFVLSQAAFQANTGVILTFGGNTVNTTSFINVYSALFALPGSLNGCRVSGSGIAPNATITNVIGTAPNYVLSLSIPNTGPVTGPLSFISDGNAAIDGNNGYSAGNMSGSFTINGTMIVTGLMYMRTNNRLAADSVVWTVNNGGLLKVGNVSDTTVSNSINIYTISSASGNGTTITYTTSLAHNYVVGQLVNITGLTPAGYNLTNGIITNVPTATTFTVNGTQTGASSGASSVTGLLSSTILRVRPGGKFEVFGLPGFASNINPSTNGLNCIYDFQSGSIQEFSGLGNQNVPVVPSASPSSGFYGNLRISGFGTKISLSSPFRIANNFDILNTSGAPVFNATASTNFFVGGNWTNYHDSAYVEGSNTVYFNGSTGIQSITCSSGEVFNNLRYAKADSTALFMNSDLKIRAQFIWNNNGFLSLNGKTLTLYNFAINALSGATSTSRYILGETGNFNSKVRWNIGTTSAPTRYAIPFAKGSGSANYTPFAFTVGPNVQVDTMTVSTYGTPATNLPWPSAAPYGVSNLNSSTNLSPDNRDATADRFWYVGFTSPNVVNDTIVLTYASPSELPASPYNIADSIRGQYWDAANGSWALPVLGYDSINVINAIVITNPPLNKVWSLVSNISPMGPLPLPIELIDFKGKYINNQSVLSWITASEKDNDYFILERSEDAHEFTQIGKIDGAGNSNSFLNYQFIDPKPINQVAYYRLKQIDFDGQYSYSQVIALRNNQKLNTEIKAYPNPSNGNFLITNIPFQTGEAFVCQVFNMQGELLKKDLHISDTNNNFQLQLNELKSGVYWVSLTNGTSTVTTRVNLIK